tara:strand:- start:316 stop:558 length:243 start_codon:yes stop_codon:yes gene_type:complete
MTEKPDQEFDPSKIPTFDPMQEFADRGQLQQIGSKLSISTKKETPAEKIEREERDRLFYETIMRERAEASQKAKETKKRY